MPLGLLQGDAQAAVGQALAAFYYPATLAQTTGNNYIPSGAGAGTVSPGATTNYPCLVQVDTYSDAAIAGGLVSKTDRKILITQISLGIGIQPGVGDKLTTRGLTYTITDVTQDPAQIYWECQGEIA